VSIGKVGAITLVVIAALATSNPTSGQPAIKDIVGCWETYGHPRDSRSLCVHADGTARVVTHRYAGGGKCLSYPPGRLRINGDKIAFDLPPGSHNCELTDGTRGDSAYGKFVCEILNPERIACHVVWQGWEPTTELYRRMQEPVS
jgi:hypothetical protein